MSAKNFVESLVADRPCRPGCSSCAKRLAALERHRQLIMQEEAAAFEEAARNHNGDWFWLERGPGPALWADSSRAAAS